MTEDMHDADQDDDRPSAEPPATDFSNQFLLAMPALVDGNFAGSVVYVCEHTTRGALGLVINRPTDLSLSALLERIELKVEGAPARDDAVYFGGPVQTDRGFVLHPAGQLFQATLELGELNLSTSQDVLFSIADGSGPAQSVIALGYAGWEAGQLEAELADNAWLTCPADLEVLFDVPAEQRLAAAAQRLGINLSLLTAQAGHA